MGSLASTHVTLQARFASRYPCATQLYSLSANSGNSILTWRAGLPRKGCLDGQALPALRRQHFRHLCNRMHTSRTEGSQQARPSSECLTVRVMCIIRLCANHISLNCHVEQLRACFLRACSAELCHASMLAMPTVCGTWLPCPDCLSHSVAMSRLLLPVPACACRGVRTFCRRACGGRSRRRARGSCRA